MVYKLILPIAALCSFLIYIFQDLVIRLLFTQDFAPMKKLMLWQIIGDVIKIGSWIIIFLMLSKAMTKTFTITETFFALSIIPLTASFIHYYGFKGIAIAFTVNYIFYWLVCSFIAFKKLREN